MIYAAFDCKTLKTSRLDEFYDQVLFWDGHKCSKCNPKCTCNSFQNLCSGCIANFVLVNNACIFETFLQQKNLQIVNKSLTNFQSRYPNACYQENLKNPIYKESPGVAQKDFVQNALDCQDNACIDQQTGQLIIQLCESGYTWNQGKCVKCNQQNCQNCNDDINICIACNNGPFFLNNGVCSQCGDSQYCLACSSDYVCKTCIQIDSVYLLNGKCEVCTLSNCLKCNQNGQTCDDCKNGYYLRSDTNKCVACPNNLAIQCKLNEIGILIITQCKIGFILNHDNNDCEACGISQGIPYHCVIKGLPILCLWTGYNGFGNNSYTNSIQNVGVLLNGQCYQQKKDCISYNPNTKSCIKCKNSDQAVISGSCTYCNPEQGKFINSNNECIANPYCIIFNQITLKCTACKLGFIFDQIGQCVAWNSNYLSKSCPIRNLDFQQQDSNNLVSSNIISTNLSVELMFTLIVLINILLIFVF